VESLEALWGCRGLQQYGENGGTKSKWRGLALPFETLREA
jgi:hypothetical protein